MKKVLFPAPKMENLFLFKTNKYLIHESMNLFSFLAMSKLTSFFHLFAIFSIAL